MENFIGYWHLVLLWSAVSWGYELDHGYSSWRRGSQPAQFAADGKDQWKGSPLLVSFNCGSLKMASLMMARQTILPAQLLTNYFKRKEWKNFYSVGNFIRWGDMLSRDIAESISHCDQELWNRLKYSIDSYRILCWLIKILKREWGKAGLCYNNRKQAESVSCERRGRQRILLSHVCRKLTIPQASSGGVWTSGKISVYRMRTWTRTYYLEFDDDEHSDLSPLGTCFGH